MLPAASVYVRMRARRRLDSVDCTRHCRLNQSINPVEGDVISWIPQAQLGIVLLECP